MKLSNMTQDQINNLISLIQLNLGRTVKKLEYIHLPLRLEKEGFTGICINGNSVTLINKYGWLDMREQYQYLTDKKFCEIAHLKAMSELDWPSGINLLNTMSYRYYAFNICFIAKGRKAKILNGQFFTSYELHCSRHNYDFVFDKEAKAHKVMVDRLFQEKNLWRFKTKKEFEQWMG